MTIDSNIPRSRRALLAGALGGLAALTASALGRPLPADATSGVFDSNTLATPAVRATHTAGGEGVRASTTAAGSAVRGDSSTGTGVYGWTTSGTGVYGWTSSGVGVRGYGSTGVGVRGSSSSGVGLKGSSAVGDGVAGDSGGSNKSGVYGYSTVEDGYGVFGRNKATGATGSLGGLGGVVGSTTDGYPGVSGFATNNPGVSGSCDTWSGVSGWSQSGDGVFGYATSGVGLHGTATTGYALRTSGRLKVEKASGVATVTATKSSVIVTPGLDVTSASFVLLTPRADLGSRRLWYTIDATNDRFTIRVSSPVATALRVGWLLLG